MNCHHKRGLLGKKLDKSMHGVAGGKEDSDTVVPGSSLRLVLL